MPETSYETLRMRLLWEKGPMFYAEYTIRLFFTLLFNKADILISNDLDTLLPNYLIHLIKRQPLIYDSHEYFTATPELTGRPFVQKFWKSIEKLIVPRLKHCITVNKSIASLFENEYKVHFDVVRNIPENKTFTLLSRAGLSLPEDKTILILQGSGINIDRGAEEAVLAMQYVEDALLLIVGGGDVMPILHQIVEKENLHEKIIFVPRQTPEKLASYTANADVGLALDKDTNINYRFSLPNKLFDYIHAGTPVLASQLVELQTIINQYEVGWFIESHNPRMIADAINKIILDKNDLKIKKQNCKKAASELTWENESHVLKTIFTQYLAK
jgi:glycosyltransferase involved in cell wall biosynthesis